MALIYPTTLTNGTTADASQVQGNFDAAKTAIDATTAVASGVAGAWRPVLRVDPFQAIVPATVGGTYAISPAVGTSGLYASGTQGTPVAFCYTTAEFAVAGMSTQFRLDAQVSVNATAPGISFAFDVRQVTSLAGGAGALTVTFGAAGVAGSPVTLVTPSASAVTFGGGAAFTLVDGSTYVLAVTIAGSPAANSVTFPTATLMMRYV